MHLNVTHQMDSFLSVSTAGVSMTDHPRQVGVHLVEQIGDLAQPLVNGIQAGGDGSAVLADHRLTQLGWGAAAQDGGEVLGVPAQGDRERFEGPGAASPLDGVVLEFAHDRLRDVRALRELALAPSEFVHAFCDGVGDRHPILRHVFLRAPPSRRG
jgi:hypothetical protein